MLVIFEIEELIVPLRDDSDGIFEKGDDNKEAADCWQISNESTASSAVHKTMAFGGTVSWVVEYAP